MQLLNAPAAQTLFDQERAAHWTEVSSVVIDGNYIVPGKGSRVGDDLVPPTIARPSQGHVVRREIKGSL